MGRLHVTACQLSGDSRTNAQGACRLERHRGLVWLLQDCVCVGCRGQQMPTVVTAANLLGSCFQLSEGKRGTCRTWCFLGSFVVAGSSSRAPLRSHPIWLSLRLDHTSFCGISGVSVHQRTIVPFCTFPCSLMLRF